MRFTSIISTADLAAHLFDPDWVVVDCRFDLAQPDWGEQSYRQSHIDGAVYAHLDRDLSGHKTPSSGRHPLPAPDAFRATVSNWGIDSSKQVVVYDTAGGSFAARLWWLLRNYGHFAVAVLDGGFQQWQAEGRPTRGGDEARQPAHFSGNPDLSMLATVEEVQQARQDPQRRVIDARAEIRYRGEQEPIDPVAGHIPGAVSLPHAANLGADGKLLPPESLRAQFAALLGDISTGQSVVYCGSGVTSAFHLVAMLYAGLEPGKLYAGSWSEWIRDPHRPIATGES